MMCCCVQVSNDTIAPLTYDIHCQIVSVTIWTMSILDIGLKDDSYNALINNSSMGIILSGQTIN